MTHFTEHPAPNLCAVPTLPKLAAPSSNTSVNMPELSRAIGSTLLAALVATGRFFRSVLATSPGDVRTEFAQYGIYPPTG